MKRLGLLFLMGYFALGGVARAATYYASRAGSDNNSCLAAQSTNTPKLTVKAGIGCLTAGDTLLVRAGTYDEAIHSVPSGTSWSNKVRVANYNGETVWLKPSKPVFPAVIWLDGPYRYIEFDGINVDGTNYTDVQMSIVSFSTNNGNDVHHIRFKSAEVIAGTIAGAAAIVLGSHRQGTFTGANEIQNVTIHGGGRTVGGGCGSGGFECQSYGVYVMGNNNLIENVDIYDTSARGISVHNSGGPPSCNNVIRNSRIHDITRTGTPGQYVGIHVADGSCNNQIYNNLFYGIGVPGAGAAAAINVWTGIDTKIWNNTVANNNAIGIKVDPEASNTEVRNNIAYNNTVQAFRNSGRNTQESNNLFGVDPLFVNPSGKDFQLRDTSPAVDAGSSLSVVASDFVGVARPQGSRPDIGAYEFRGQAAAPGPPAPPTGVRIVSN